MMTECEEIIRKKVLAEMDLSREVEDSEIYALIDNAVYSSEKSMSLAERIEARKTVFDSLRGLDVLQPLIDDDEVTEIMVNNSTHIFYEKAGKLKRFEGGFISPEKLEDTDRKSVV